MIAQFYTKIVETRIFENEKEVFLFAYGEKN